MRFSGLIGSSLILTGVWTALLLPVRGFCFFDEASFFSPSPLLSAGFRLRPDRFFGGAQLLTFKVRRGEHPGAADSFWAFLSPGIHYQEDGKMIFSVAPVSVVGDSGLGASLQLFPIGPRSSGGALGFSVGYHWF